MLDPTFCIYRPSQSFPRASRSSAGASQSWPRPPQPPKAAGATAFFFLTFWYPSQLKGLVLRAFLAGHIPKKLSKLGVVDEKGMKKSEKNITPEWGPKYFSGKLHIKCPNSNSSEGLHSIRRSPAKWSQEPLVGGHRSHAPWPGWRELNKLPQIKVLLLTSGAERHV